MKSFNQKTKDLLTKNVFAIGSHLYRVQRGIGPQFFKMSPASALSPIMTKFHSIPYTPPATQYREGRWRIKKLKSIEFENCSTELKLILTYFSEKMNFC
jgi:hypothetical protein